MSQLISRFIVTITNLTNGHCVAKSSSMMIASEFPCIGCRVVDNEGYKATVRYVGPVKGAKNPDEKWLGVEWDIPSRGKHDGSSIDSSGKLHRYFSCTNNSGSFIKPTKVSHGRSFLAALYDRYVALDAPSIADQNGTVPNSFVNTFKGNQKTIEFVGEEKIRFGVACRCPCGIHFHSIIISSSSQEKATDCQCRQCCHSQ